MRVEITVTMYFIMKRCPLSFDPGGKKSLLLVFLALVMGFSQFNEVHCFTATSEETWQRRLEFPEARHARNRNVVVVARTTSSLSKFTFPEYKTSELVNFQSVLNRNVYIIVHYHVMTMMTCYFVGFNFYLPYII